MIKRFVGVALAALLAACSGGSGDLPSVRPAAVVSGNAVDAEIRNGNVTVYTFGRNGKGERLASGVTDAKGFYSIELRAPSQPVLIEVTGGDYTEEASGVTVKLGEGQVLRAVARYVSGQALSVMVTPLTHLAAGLAEYHVTHGLEAGASVDAAVTSMNDLFGLAVTQVLPRNITDASAPAAPQAGAPDNYGFFLAALSSFSQWAGQQNNVAAHTVYTTIGLSQVMYNDLRSDGVLDGRGFNKAGDAMMNLALGTVALNQDVYRIAVAQHLLAMSASAQNKTGFGRAELRPVARGLATSSHPVFGGKVPTATSAFGPVIVPKLAPGSSFNGAYTFEVVIGSVLGAETVRFDVNGVAVGEAVDPAHPAVVIDTRGYADGEYTLGVAATDFLGFASYQQFTYRFDNVFVNVTSAPASNQTPFVLSGTYGDNGFGLKSFTVQGKSVTPNSDKTWSVPVDLALGRNRIPVVIATQTGPTEQSEVIVDYDVGLPVVDTGAGHGAACFSKGDGTCDLRPLADRNENAPVTLFTDHTELAGVAITREALGGNAIPYFAFAAHDPPANGVATPAAELGVRVQYEKNGQTVAPWRAVSPVEGQYLLPLATEGLGDAWLRSSPNDVQVLRVEVTDRAGNRANAVFSFKADFVVAPFAVDAPVDAGRAFAGTPFTQRQNLFGATVTAIEYPFTNTTGKAFYLRPDDDSVHGVDNLIDRLVRENQVRLKTASEWRAGFIENQLQLDQCPSLPNDVSGNEKWTPVTQILNNTGTSAWTIVKVPNPSVGGVQSASADNPAPPAPSAWSQLADFDGAYGLSTQAIAPGMQLSYEFDYILNIASVFRPAAVRNWRFVDNTVSPPAVKTCPNINFLQQRQVYAYQSEPGFPRNSASTLQEGASFITSGFSVFDMTANASIGPLGGWYRIPAGHAVVVRKEVKLPALTLHNDTDVADPAAFMSYIPRLYDRTLTWSIKRHVKLALVHDGGEGNLLSMSSRMVATGDGAATYRVSR